MGNRIKYVLELSLSCFLLAMLLVGCQAGKNSYQQGVEAYRSKEYSEALRLFEQAVNQNDSNAEYYVALGMAQIHMNQSESALESFQLALHLEEGNRQAMRGMGLAYMSLGEYEKAVSAFESALQSLKDLVQDFDVDILYYLAESQMRAGQYEEAYQSYGKLISLEVDVTRCFLYQMEVCFAMNEVEQGLDCLASALKQDAHDYDIYMEANQILQECGYEQQGTLVLEKALELTVSSAQDYLGRGNIYYELGKIDLAQSDFEQSYEMGWNEAGIALIRCYVEQGEYDKADSLWDKYQYDESNHTAEVYYKMSTVKIIMGEYEAAMQLISQAYTLDDGTWTQSLKWNEAVLYEYEKDYKTAYEKLSEYGQLYGYTDEVQKEINYVKTR